jgi:hypothetical protein
MIKLGETCSCGRHHISPVPLKCSRCGKDMRTGCLEGENYRVVNQSKTEKVDDEFGKMTIEFLQPTITSRDGDTSLFPR